MAIKTKGPQDRFAAAHKALDALYEELVTARQPRSARGAWELGTALRVLQGRYIDEEPEPEFAAPEQDTGEPIEGDDPRTNSPADLGYGDAAA